MFISLHRRKPRYRQLFWSFPLSPLLVQCLLTGKGGGCKEQRPQDDILGGKIEGRDVFGDIYCIHGRAQ